MPDANVKSQEIRRSYAGQSALDRRAERRERLMNAGLDLFGGIGYGGTSIERLCTAAAVSTRNFYEEFTGREALLMALHDRVMQRAADAVAKALDRTGDAPIDQRIRSGFRAYITHTAGDPRWARIAYVEVVGVSPAVERNRAAWRARCADILVGEAGRSVARGETHDRDFGLTAIAIVGAINELVHHWSLQRDPAELERVISEIVAIAQARIVGCG
jgi:AcrR family transcriptional regulator